MIKKFSYIFFPIILVLSCEDVAPTQDNPLDPGNEDYVEPTITFVMTFLMVILYTVKALH